MDSSTLLFNGVSKQDPFRFYLIHLARMGGLQLLVMKAVRVVYPWEDCG